MRMGKGEGGRVREEGKGKGKRGGRRILGMKEGRNVVENVRIPGMGARTYTPQKDMYVCMYTLCIIPITPLWP